MLEQQKKIIINKLGEMRSKYMCMWVSVLRMCVLACDDVVMACDDYDDDDGDDYMTKTNIYFMLN